MILRAGWRTGAPLLATLVLAGVAASPAGAAATTVAGWGHGAGKVNNPIGVAVDNSVGPNAGDLYVADGYNRRVDKFDSEGDFLLAWGWGVADGKSQELQVCGPATEPPTKRCFAGFNGAGPGAVVPEAVAVEPSTGDVYVADSVRLRISKFTPSGELIYVLGSDISFSGPGNTGADETQTLTVKASAGTFTLSLTAPVPTSQSASEQSTAPIPFDATHEGVQEALEALSNVEPGDLTVSGGPGDATGSSPYEVDFGGGPFAGNDIAQMSADSTKLVGSQTVSVQGATGGSFKLTFKEETAPIPYNATAAEVQAKLAALATIGAGNVSVTGSPGGPWTVTFTGSLSGAPQPAISASAKGQGYELTPSSASVSVAPPAAVPTISVPGGGPEVCEPGRGDVCKVAGGSGAIAGELTGPRSLAFDSKGKLWVNDGMSGAGTGLKRFDSDGAFLEEVPLPAGTRSLALAIDPASDDFYVLGPAGSNEVQFVEVPSNLEFQEHGEYTLGFEGETTDAFAGTASEAGAEEIQKALEGLAAIGAGNVRVESQAGRYRVEFIHDLGGRDVSQLVATTLSPTPPVAVLTNQQGTPGSVRRLDGAGALIETLDDEPGDIPRALATDSPGNLYVGDAGAPYHLLRYDSSGNLSSRFAAGQVLGAPQGNALALDEAAGTLYSASSEGADDSYEDPDVGAAARARVAVQAFPLPEPGPLPEDPRAEDVLPTSATLKAELNPEGRETTYFFEYGEDEGYGQSTPVETLPGEEFDSEGVEAELEGLTPDTTYHFRLVATDHGDPNPNCAGGECTVYGEDTTFHTRTAIGIEAERASAVAAHDATLEATLDPLGAANAVWWVEYDTSPYGEGEAPHGTHVAGGSLPASFGSLQRSLALSGLAPGTAYHYRFVAEGDQDGTTYTTYGSDRSFATQPAGLGFALPDSRAWEMVSPPDKAGGRIAAPDGAQGGQVQAAADGSALAYLSYGSLEANPEGNRLIEQSSELARRAPGGAWSTADITPPHTSVTGVALGTGLEYKLFSTNLGRALLEPRDCTPLSPTASERTPYLRENGEPPAYTPLVMAASAPFGGKCGANAGSVRVKGATPDLGHVVLQSDVPLVEGAPAKALYEWAGGSLEPVSVKPADEGGGTVGAELGSGAASVRGAISEDGSRVFFTASGVLYVRDLALGETARLDEEQEGAFGTGAAKPLFQGASADGAVAFFTDTQNLTEDANEEGADLYRWRAQGSGGCEATGGCLTDISAETKNPEDPFESAEVQGLLAGMSEDGSHLYLIARGVLDAGSNERGESAVPGQPNLYAWSEAGGMRFIATLAAADYPDWGAPFLPAAPSGAAFQLTAAASPSGRYLAFMSQLPLSGYDNRAVGSGERAQEVFRYDAATEEIACVSCDPSGARPHALVPGSDAGQLAEEFDPNQLWSAGGARPVAAVVPEATKISLVAASLYRPRYVHDDGRVFFNAADSLVAADSNGDGDVYQYEPAGTGTCTTSSGDAGTALLPGGCVSLISSGAAAGTSAFLDASEGANDVFFYTPAPLSVSDEDEELDVYDARVNGEPATLNPSAECQGEACQPPAAAPESQTPGSATFRGPGNVREGAPHRHSCPKGRRKVKRKGKVRCVDEPRKHRHSHRKHRHRRSSR